MHAPVWELFVDGTESLIHWVDHSPNRRFALFSASTQTHVDDLVWDKETDGVAS